jgi:hypothetical protein
MTFSMIREPTINRIGYTPSLFQGGLGWVKVLKRHLCFLKTIILVKKQKACFYIS